MPHRLADSTSAYLRSAADHQVDWHPWGDEAFARARALERPILLDIGASWCRACHEMDRECYRDPSVADFVNERYVAIRVDRDERPDVDDRYQAAVAQLTGLSGWPLTAFLTPEATLYFGGTSFPLRPRGSSPGFLQILTWASELYRSSPESRLEEGRRLRQSLAGRWGWARSGAQAPAPRSLAEAAADLLEAYDRRHGGFGDEPKFPLPNVLEVLLRAGRDPSQTLARTALAHTLSVLTRGALHDRLGGGFHRYAVDAAFTEPHFEKLLCTQAELLRVLARAARAGFAEIARDPHLTWEIERAARGTVRFLLETLGDSESGVFGASQASPEDGGAALLWSPKEIEAAAGPELAAFASHLFGTALEGGGAPLAQAVPLELAARRAKLAPESVRAAVDALEKRLTAARAARMRPPVDRTVVPAWNGLAITALLEASQFLGEPDWAAAAHRALAALDATHVSPDGSVRRSHVAVSFLVDAVAVALASIHAYERGADGVHLDRAEAILRRTVATHWDASAAAFADGSPDGAAPKEGAFPIFPFEDGLHASGNALALRALSRFLVHRKNAAFDAVADALAITVSRARGTFDPLSLAGAWVALDDHSRRPPRVMIVGRDPAARRRFVSVALNGTLEPIVLEAESAASLADDLPPVSSGAGKDAVAFLCDRGVCAAPFLDPADLEGGLVARGEKK